MKSRVRLSLLIICSLVCTACANTETVEVQPQSSPQTVSVQDTLGMKPDFSYVLPRQVPHIFVDQRGYCPEDKKIAYFIGDDLETFYEVRDVFTDQTVYTGTLVQTVGADDEVLYIGIFSEIRDKGKYYIWQPQIGESYEFEISDSIYERQFLALQRQAKEYEYTNVSDAVYMLTNMLFAQEMFEDVRIDYLYVEEMIASILNSQDISCGGFYAKLYDEPIENGYENAGQGQQVTQQEDTISLTTTAQVAGLLAKYAYLYKEKEPEFAMQCLRTAQEAYKYMEKYRGNTETDAWYFAATELFRATGRNQYRAAIREYDEMDSALKSRSPQNYTIIADFTYLSTNYGTDYKRCATLLDSYMERAQEISVHSTKENFCVHPSIAEMDDGNILDDMIVLGVVNRVLSGQEYEGIERNYIHYLSGANPEAEDYLTDRVLAAGTAEEINITNVAKLLVILGDME